jgi:hypothetical protein
MLFGLRSCVEFGSALGLTLGIYPNDMYIGLLYHIAMKDESQLLSGLLEVRQPNFFSESLCSTMPQPSITAFLPETQLASAAQKLHVLNSLSHFPFQLNQWFPQCLLLPPIGQWPRNTSAVPSCPTFGTEYGADLLLS